MKTIFKKILYTFSGLFICCVGGVWILGVFVGANYAKECLILGFLYGIFAFVAKKPPFDNLYKDL